MLLNFLILLIPALLAGLAVFFVPHPSSKVFKKLLAFSGAYLFSITVLHLLPELFLEAKDVHIAGFFVLLGFFFQLILEYFTSGVEHGHIHVHDHGHHHSFTFSILISLSIHAFLEGTLISHPSSSHDHGDPQSLLFGLVLHKIPEAFAFMSVLVGHSKNKVGSFLLFLIFAFASPLGMVTSHFILEEAVLDKNIFVFLFSLVAGNFLYISTTIFFETSPDHTFKAHKLTVCILGAAAAVLAEYLL